MRYFSLLLWLFLFSVGSIQASPTSDVSSFRVPLNGGPHRITQGPRCSVSHNDNYGIRNREAIDFGVLNLEVVAPEGGVADYIYDAPTTTNPLSGGNIVQILHDNGLKSVFAHLSTPSSRNGFPRRVEKGEVIAISGNSGNVASHLHFAVLSGSNDLRSLAGSPVAIWGITGITWPNYAGLPYPDSGSCDPSFSDQGTAQWPSPGEKRLELERFTLERTNPKSNEDLQFEAILKNTGEVQIWWKNIL